MEFKVVDKTHLDQSNLVLCQYGMMGEATRAFEEQIKPRSGPLEHHGITCDLCDKIPIIGSRYTCVRCNGHDIRQHHWIISTSASVRAVIHWQRIFRRNRDLSVASKLNVSHLLRGLTSECEYSGRTMKKEAVSVSHISQAYTPKQYKPQMLKCLDFLMDVLPPTIC